MSEHRAFESLRWLAAPALMAALAVPGLVPTAHAAYAVSADPAPSFSGSPSARARNGRSGFEAVLFTPASPTGVQLNPAGTPAWTYGAFYNFEFKWISATGTATWSIDFNRDLDYLDAQERASSTTPGLAGKGFNYVNLFLDGRNDGTAGGINYVTNPVGVHLNNFTLNGTNFGSYSNLTSTDLNRLFKYTGGSFDITATGSFRFTGDGSSDELPRLWIQLAQPLPVPGSLALAVAAIAGLGFVRRRRA